MSPALVDLCIRCLMTKTPSPRSLYLCGSCDAFLRRASDLFAQWDRADAMKLASTFRTSSRKRRVTAQVTV